MFTIEHWKFELSNKKIENFDILLSVLYSVIVTIPIDIILSPFEILTYIISKKIKKEIYK